MAQCHPSATGQEHGGKSTGPRGCDEGAPLERRWGARALRLGVAPRGVIPLAGRGGRVGAHRALWAPGQGAPRVLRAAPPPPCAPPCREGRSRP